MEDYKLEAAKGGLNLIKAGQKIGFGAGSSIFYLIDMITKNEVLVQSLSFASSSFKTRQYLISKGLKSKLISSIEVLDIYFDGCDQFDKALNALKSGGGIHTSEKIMASAAKEFILVGDESKFAEKLDEKYPLVVEILPEALAFVLNKIQSIYPQSIITIRMACQKDGAVITENGNLLADISFSTIPNLAELNSKIKMIPGVVEHSLFYKIATKAVIAGKKGLQIIKP